MSSCSSGDVGEPADAATLAEKLLVIIREPFQIDGHELRMSVSIGIAMYPGNGANQHELLTNADAAMYHAKSLGRDSFCFFEASMNSHVQAHLEIDAGPASGPGSPRTDPLLPAEVRGAERPGDRRGSAGAVGAPDARSHSA